MMVSRQGQNEVADAFGWIYGQQALGFVESDLIRFLGSEGAIDAANSEVDTKIWRRGLSACSAFGQLRAHQLVQQVHRLERAHHDLEMRDLAVSEADDVDAVDGDAVDFFF